VPLVEGAARTGRFFDRLAPWYQRINAWIYRPEWLNRDDAVGIDLSREMLRRARYRGQLVRADFMKPPFRGGWFSTIVFAGSFYYLRDPDDAAKISAHLLGPSGRLVLLSPATNLFAPFVNVYSRRAYEEIFVRAGLGLPRYERLNWAACLVIAEKS